MKINTPFKNIAVIGAGTMGSGIAGQIANSDQEVLLLCWLFICGHTLLSICSIVKTNWNIFSARL